MIMKGKSTFDRERTDSDLFQIGWRRVKERYLRRGMGTILFYLFSIFLLNIIFGTMIDLQIVCLHILSIILVYYLGYILGWPVHFAYHSWDDAGLKIVLTSYRKKKKVILLKISEIKKIKWGKRRLKIFTESGVEHNIFEITTEFKNDLIANLPVLHRP